MVFQINIQHLHSEISPINDGGRLNHQFVDLLLGVNQGMKRSAL